MINAEGYSVLTVFTLAFLDLIFMFNIFVTGFAVIPSSGNIMKYQCCSAVPADYKLLTV